MGATDEATGSFGAQLRSDRRLAGLSQEELAQRSGLSTRTIRNLEHGRTRWPYRDSLHRLADALELRDAARASFLDAGARRLGGSTATDGAATTTAKAKAAAAVSARRRPESWLVPRCLPAGIPAFAGRRGPLAELARVLDEPGGTAVVTAIGGMAGVGKTALAVHWAHQVAGHFPDGQLYVNLRGFGPSEAPVSPADAVRIFLDALQVPADRLPGTLDAQLSLYRSLLAGQRILVVLDNARDVTQVRPLLPGSPTCRVVVTSRNQLTGLAALEGAHLLTLDVLTSPEAHELLSYRVGGRRAEADPDAAARIIEACARLPLALSIIGARAALRPAQPLSELAAALAERPGLDAFTTRGDPAADARAVFSWSYRQLDPDAARVFRLAGLHPGPSLDRDTVAALAGLPAERAGRLLDVLAGAGLLQTAGPGRFGLHDLLRGYARELASADAGEDAPTALTRLFGYYLRVTADAMDTAFPAERAGRPAAPAGGADPPRFATESAARVWLDAERPSLVAIAEHMAGYGWLSEVIQLSALLYRYLDVGAHYTEATAIHRCARQAAGQLRDPAAEANALNRLGSLALRQRRYQQAVQCYEQALARHRETGDQAGEATALTNLAFVSVLQGRVAQAEDHFEQALILCRAAGERAVEARTLAQLGFVNLRQGRYPRATRYLRQSLDLQAQVGDRGGEAYALGLLGDVELRQGHYRQATGHLLRSLDLWRQFGERSNQADVLAMLGLIDLRQGHHPHAMSHLDQALVLCRETGDRSTEATVLNHRGEVLLATRQPSGARIHHSAALDLASQVGEKYEQARAHAGLGASYEASGAPARAGRHWREAYALYTGLGAPEADLIRGRLGQADAASGA